MTQPSEYDLNAALLEIPGWHMTGGELVREWSFKDFATALQFVNAVAAAAEQANHHPDIGIRYNRVRLALRSHDQDAVTERDVKLARTIDRLPTLR